MNNLQFGPGAFIFISAYLAGLLMLGFIAKRARRDESVSEFYLAGNSLGGLVLLLTLYAT